VLEADFEERFAAAVLGFGTDSLRAKAVLAGLHERSLVLLDANNRRYRLHELIQAIAAKVFEYEAHSLGGTTEARLSAARQHSKTYCAELLVRINDGLSAADYEAKKQALEPLKLELENLPAAIASVKASFQTGRKLDKQEESILMETIELIGQGLELAFSDQIPPAQQREALDNPLIGEASWMLAQFHAEYIGDLATGRKFANWALKQFCKMGDARIKQVRESLKRWRKATPRSRAFDRTMRVLMARIAKEAEQAPTSQEDL
jgi:hypothetical protein